MESFLIKVRKNRWFPEGKPDWFPGEDVPAAALQDFRVDHDGTLSVWHIDAHATNLHDVAVALASTWSKPDHFEALLFSPSCLDGIGIGIAHTRGNTPFDAANRWHRDLTQVSGRRLVTLAIKLFETARRELILKKELVGRLLATINDGRIDESKLPESLRRKLRIDER